VGVLARTHPRSLPFRPPTLALRASPLTSPNPFTKIRLCLGRGSQPHPHQLGRLRSAVSSPMQRGPGRSLGRQRVFPHFKHSGWPFRTARTMDHSQNVRSTKNKSFYLCFSIINAHYEGCHATQHKYTQLDTSDTSSHKLVFVLLCALIYNKQISHTNFTYWKFQWIFYFYGFLAEC